MDEKRYIHKHPIVLLRHVWWMPLAPLSLLFGWQIFVLVMAATAARLWWVWTDFRNDMYVLGNGQLTQVRKQPLSVGNEEHKSVALNQIVGTDFNLGGWMQKRLGYGTVKVLTANERFNMVLTPIMQPVHAQELIREFVDKEKRNGGRFFSDSVD